MVPESVLALPRQKPPLASDDAVAKIAPETKLLIKEDQGRRAITEVETMSPTQEALERFHD